MGRMGYSFPTLRCVPNALFPAGGYMLGAQAGEAAIRHIVIDVSSPDSAAQQMTGELL
jgi:hypothetical protein